MSKFPLLEQMRAERQRAENEITAPYKAEIQIGARMIAALNQRIRMIESALGTDIAESLKEQIAAEISNKLMKLIFDAVGRQTSPGRGVNIMLPPDVARFLDPNSIESEVLRRYQDTLPRLSLRVDASPSDRATVIDIRVPELGYRHALAKL